MPNDPDNDFGSIEFSVTKPNGVTWTKIFKGWWPIPAAFAAVFGVPLLLCFVGVLIGRA